MKALFAVAFVFSVMAISQSASACSQAEAQFIAKVSKVQRAGTTCNIQISEISHYNESGVCGLNVSHALSSWIEVSNCSLKKGQTVSGYLVLDESGKIKLD